MQSGSRPREPPIKTSLGRQAFCRGKVASTFATGPGMTVLVRCRCNGGGNPRRQKIFPALITNSFGWFRGSNTYVNTNSISVPIFADPPSSAIHIYN